MSIDWTAVERALRQEKALTRDERAKVRLVLQEEYERLPNKDEAGWIEQVASDILKGRVVEAIERMREHMTNDDALPRRGWQTRPRP